MAKATATTEGERGRFDPNPNVNWYRTPIDHDTLADLMQRSDLRGWIQTLLHLGLFFAYRRNSVFCLPADQYDELVLVGTTTSSRIVFSRHDRTFYGFDRDSRTSTSNGV